MSPSKNPKTTTLKKKEETIIKITSQSNSQNKNWFQSKKKDTSSTTKKKLQIIIFICSIFIIIEIIGAYLSRSIAIFTDAAHLMSDLIGFTFSLVSIYIAEEKPSLKKTFGKIRVEILGAMVSVFIVWVLGVWVFYEAFLRAQRIMNNEVIFLRPSIMVFTACLAFMMNLIMIFCLGAEDHHEEIDDSNSEEEEKINLLDNTENTENSENKDINENKLILKLDEIKEIDNKKESSQKTEKMNQNIKAAQIHILGDLLQSSGVILISSIIYFHPNWIFLDPIISIIFTIISISFTIPISIEIFYLLIDATPSDLDIKKLKENILNLENVKSIHEFHLRDIILGKPSLTCHVICEKYFESILQNITLECRKFGIYHSTVQIEIVGNKYIVNCDHDVHL